MCNAQIIAHEELRRRHDDEWECAECEVRILKRTWRRRRGGDGGQRRQRAAFLLPHHYHRQYHNIGIPAIANAKEM